MSQIDAGTAFQEATGQALALIANEMVRLHKEQFGRGPSRARAHWAGPDTIVVVLEETLTPGERRLRDMGEHERLRVTRQFFQYASVPEFCEPVEQATGRRVRSFISGVDSVSDVAIETFVLYREGENGPLRADHPRNGEFTKQNHV